MKYTRQATATFMKSVLINSIVLALVGCLGIEDKGSVENVGTPVDGEANFTVEVPPPDSQTGTNPDTSNEDPSMETPQVPPNIEFSISIDNNAEHTSLDQVTMSLAYLPWFSEVKITSNATCEGGTWEPVVDVRTLAVHTPNAVNSYSVRFRDNDHIQSLCIVDSIIHDNKGPDINFSKFPMATLEEGATGEIEFNVTDVSPIANVTCQLNEVTKPCLAGANAVRLSQMPAGHYVFKVTAEDSRGYSSTKEVSWNVVSTVRHLTHTVEVKDDRKVDVLIVIDNSGSMAYEQKNMADRVKNMLSILRGLDYRIGVTTTDSRSTFTKNGVKYYGDGDLIPIHNLGGNLWVDSTMDEQQAQYNLGQTLQRPETGSPSEQGIRATYRFVEKATTPNHVLSSFFREGSNFASLIISDEDESDVKDMNNPENLLKLVASRFNSQKAFSLHAIVTKPDDTICRNTNGATYGVRYKRAVELTGGVLGSVCEVDYANQVSGIAEEIRNLVKNITLACEPLSQFPIAVKRNGVAYSVPYVADGVNLKFSEILDPGTYTVEYTCLK